MAARAEGKRHRAPGSGQILERTPGKRYTVRLFVGRDEAGRKRYDNYRIEGSKKDAEAFLRDKLAAQDKGAYVRPTSETVAQFLRRWLETREWKSARTRDDYSDIVERFIIPKLGNIKLTALSQSAIRELYAELRERGLTRRLTYTHSVLRAALREAEGDETNGLVRNPIRGIKTPTTKNIDAPVEDGASDDDKTVRALSRDEACRFLAAAENSPHAALFWLALDSGMRPSEILALRWSDFSDDFSKVSVRRAVETVRATGTPESGSDGTTSTNGKITSRIRNGLKTEKSRRAIPLNSAVAALLRAHRDRQEFERRKLGPGWQDRGLVFTNERGGLLDHANLRRRHFKVLLKAAGIDPDRFRLYDLRHTCATLLLQDGESVKTVADRLGHADPVLTLRTYSHCLPEHQQAATERLGRLLFRAAQAS
jgi:integrase